MQCIAVALDRRGMGAVKAVNYYYNDTNSTLHINMRSASPYDDCASDIWNLEDKKLWFEDLFQTKVSARIS